MTRREEGFTLLEILVALTILAVAAGTVLAAATQQLRQAEAMENRTLALWIAENRLTELRLSASQPVAPVEEVIEMARRRWQVRLEIGEGPEPVLRRAVVSVRLANARDGHEWARLAGFVGRK